MTTYQLMENKLDEEMHGAPTDLVVFGTPGDTFRFAVVAPGLWSDARVCAIVRDAVLEHVARDDARFASMRAGRLAYYLFAYEEATYAGSHMMVTQAADGTFHAMSVHTSEWLDPGVKHYAGCASAADAVHALLGEGALLDEDELAPPDALAVMSGDDVIGISPVAGAVGASVFAELMRERARLEARVNELALAGEPSSFSLPAMLAEAAGAS